MVLQSEVQPSRKTCGASSRSQTFGPCSTLALVARYPRVLSCAILRHPCKTGLLLHRTEVDSIRQLLAVVPLKTVRGILRQLLNRISRQKFFDVLVPLLNSPELRAPMTIIIMSLEARHIVSVLNAVPLSKLAIVVGGAPPDAITAVISAVEPNRLDEALVPLLQEPETLLRDTLVPLLRCNLQHLGSIVNKAETRMLLWLLRGVDSEHLISLVTVLEPSDVEVGSTLVEFLKIAANEPDLVDEKVLPLLNQADPTKLVPFLRGVKAEQLLAVLRCVDADGINRLLNNTNTELIVRLCNGPLDDVVRLCLVADGLAVALRNPFAAQTVKHASDVLNVVAKGVQGAMDRGKDVRGVTQNSPYEFGDVTRGFMGMLGSQKLAIDEYGILM